MQIKGIPPIDLSDMSDDIDEYLQMMLGIVNIRQRNLDPDRMVKLTRNLDNRRRAIHNRMIQHVIRKIKKADPAYAKKMAARTDMGRLEYFARHIVSTLAEWLFEEQEYKSQMHESVISDAALKTYQKAARKLGIDPSGAQVDPRGFVKHVRQAIKDLDIYYYGDHYDGYEAKPGTAQKIEKLLLERGIPVVAIPNLQRHGYSLPEGEKRIVEEAQFFLTNEAHKRKVEWTLIDEGLLYLTKRGRKKFERFHYDSEVEIAQDLPKHARELRRQGMRVVLHLPDGIEIPGLLKWKKRLDQGQHTFKPDDTGFLDRLADRYGFHPVEVKSHMDFVFRNMYNMPVQGGPKNEPLYLWLNERYGVIL